MEEIVINGSRYDCYFILGVTPNDPITHIEKMFKQKALILHPDKMSPRDRLDKTLVEHRKKHYDILVQCYQTLVNKTKSFASSDRPNVLPVFNDRINEYRQTAATDAGYADVFNSEFDKTFYDPNSQGYTTSDRLTDVKDYERFNDKPRRAFQTYDRNEFNKMFEYNQECNSGPGSGSEMVMHKTTDGFTGYNSGTLNGAAQVVSYNGELTIGDNFGGTLGYSGFGGCDYRQGFGVANPGEQIRPPNDYIPNSTRLAEELAEKARGNLNRKQTLDIPQTSYEMQEEALEKVKREALRQEQANNFEYMKNYRRPPGVAGSQQINDIHDLF